MNPIAKRAVLTVLVLIAWGVVASALSVGGTLALGNAAGGQMANANAGYVGFSLLTTLFRGVNGLAALGFVVVMVVIWWAPGRSLLTRLLPILALGLLLPPPAQAYYDKTDFTEAYTILPNETAFWVPDAGANKDNQAQFESEDYLKANKVPVKRFIVPHAKLSGSGGFFDFYVPSGRLIIVDRTPYSREWVAASDRGTSRRNESFPCQSKEGLNVGVGVSIGASVQEADAAKFLYRFGVLPPQGDRSDPRVIFTSVYYSRKLADVMDDVGRKKVQTLVCTEITARSFDKVNDEANLIMQNVAKATTAYFASVGITIEFIGWADTFSFDKDVQQAVNDRYTADKIAPVLETLKTKAALDAAGKWNGTLPSNVSGLWVLPAGLLESVAKWFVRPADVPPGK